MDFRSYLETERVGRVDYRPPVWVAPARHRRRSDRPDAAPGGGLRAGGRSRPPRRHRHRARRAAAGCWRAAAPSSRAEPVTADHDRRPGGGAHQRSPRVAVPAHVRGRLSPSAGARRPRQSARHHLDQAGGPLPRRSVPARSSTTSRRCPSASAPPATARSRALHDHALSLLPAREPRRRRSVRVVPDGPPAARSPRGGDARSRIG